jgi:uncharacterized protein (UPF0335 family)
MEILDDDDIPAFLKADRDVNKIVDDLGDDDDFDFPSLDDDEGDDLGLPDDEPVTAEAPKPEPKPKKETKADKQAKLKQQPAEQTELKTALDTLDKIAKEEAENPRARPGNNSGGVEAGPLRAFIERIERLEEAKKEVADDIKDVKAEAKGVGYDVKTIAKILKLRKQDKAEREEEEALLDMYMFALNMA